LREESSIRTESSTTWVRHRALGIVVLVGGVVLSGCSLLGSTPQARFNPEGDVAVACMVHQSQPPGTDYTDRARADLGRNLAVFKYYALNATKGYCDGAGPTSADRAWAQFTADQTGNRAEVAKILDAPGG